MSCVRSASMTGSMAGHSLRVGTITETGGGEGLGVTGRAGHVFDVRLDRSANSIRDCQVVQQSFGFSQIGRRKTFGESLVGVAEQLSSWFRLALVAP